MDIVKAERREERLKAALRDNLKRRKAQARERQGPEQRPDHEADREPGAPESHGPEAQKGRPE